MDGLKDFPEAIESVAPQAAVQLCVVHMVRQSLNCVSWKMRKAVVADTRTVYAVATLPLMCVEGSTEAPPPRPTRNRLLNREHSCRQTARIIVVQSYAQLGALQRAKKARRAAS